MFQRVVIFGASRGLGRAVARHLPLHVPTIKHLTLVARKRPLLDQLADELVSLTHFDKSITLDFQIDCRSIDLSLSDGEDKAKALIRSAEFDLILYVAGGGPHGPYAEKAMKDHRWCWQTSFLTPASLIHEWLSCGKGVFAAVGSRVAEAKPDLDAASYAAAKHALLGLISSLQPELCPEQSLRLFSPGYIDTELLPPTAPVRFAEGYKLLSSDAAAQALLRWLKQDGPWHRVLS